MHDKTCSHEVEREQSDGDHDILDLCLGYLPDVIQRRCKPCMSLNETETGRPRIVVEFVAEEEISALARHHQISLNSLNLPHKPQLHMHEKTFAARSPDSDQRALTVSEKRSSFGSKKRVCGPSSSNEAHN